MANHVDQWTCAVCSKVYVIPTFARDCEERHNNEDKAR